MVNNIFDTEVKSNVSEVMSTVEQWKDLFFRNRTSGKKVEYSTTTHQLTGAEEGGAGCGALPGSGVGIPHG